jgi:hypothetical protein
VNPSDDHPYAKAKGIALRKIRMYRGSLEHGGMKCDGSLVVLLLMNFKRLPHFQIISEKAAKTIFRPAVYDLCDPIGRALAGREQPAHVDFVEGALLTLHLLTRIQSVALPGAPRRSALCGCDLDGV